MKWIIYLWIPILTFIVDIEHSQAQKKGQMGKSFTFREQFKHSVGFGAIFYDGKTGSEIIPEINYSPSLSLTKNLSDFSITIGSHLSFGYHPSGSDSIEGEFFYANLPLLVELNFGHNASKDFYYDMGWFVGGGYTYNLFKEHWQNGPVGTIGFRTFVFGPSFTFRYMRFFAISEDDQSLHGISVSLNLGRYFEQVKRNNKISRFKNSK